MRTIRDRIRHAISFEIIGLALIIPLGALVFDQPWHAVGVVGLVGATGAMVWNFIYNIAFDHALKRLTGGVYKPFGVRVVHAALFEAGLLVLFLPFVAWYLGIALIEALIFDIAYAAFFVVYAFVFNLAYDTVFPLP